LATTVYVRKGEYGCEVRFTRPHVAIFAPQNGLIDSLYESCETLGASLGNLRFDASSPDLSKTCVLSYFLGSVLRVFADRIEFISPISLAREQVDRAIQSALIAVSRAEMDVKVSSMRLTAAVHAEVAGERPEDLVRRLISPPVIHGATPSLITLGLAFSSTADSPSFTTQIEPSIGLPGGLFVRSTATYLSADGEPRFPFADPAVVFLESTHSEILGARVIADPNE